MNIAELQNIARLAGFSYLKELDMTTLTPHVAVRAMCEENRCGKFGMNWTCPPACGSLEQCREGLKKYTAGLLVQTVGQIEDCFDFEGIQRIETQHKAHFSAMCDVLRESEEDFLALGAGCCTVCEKCTYPDSPCRYPKYAQPSLEAFGLLVSELCIKNKLDYYYGGNRIAFVGCFLFKM